MLLRVAGVSAHKDLQDDLIQEDAKLVACRKVRFFPRLLLPMLVDLVDFSAKSLRDSPKSLETRT